jgi:LysM repeat protein
MRRASLFSAAFLAAALLASLDAAPARADFPGFVHVVREGETLASIAQRYYGDPRRETVLVAENGLEAEGGAAIVVGMRLTVPQVAYHRVMAGETWASIAERYFGTATRAFAIQGANPTIEGAQPTEGAELLIPYPLRHVASQRDTLNHVAQDYYGDIAEARTLRRFNGLRTTRLSRGQVILVPLSDLVLSEEGRRLVEESTGSAPAGGEVRALQERIALELPTLGEAIGQGHYTEAVAIGNRLLGAGELTGNQVVTIERALAVAYVALGRADLATAAFVEALRHQPDLELDTRRTSPTVLEAFEAARAAMTADLASDAGPVDGSVPDAGVPAAP